jgi:RNA polymerase sigma factor (sigma-70 family)
MTTRLVVSAEKNCATRLDQVSPEEFTSIYREFLTPISKYLARRVEASEIEELASRVFEIAWQKRTTAPKDFELPWLYRIAGFVVSNHRRSKKSQSDFLALLQPVDYAPSVEDIALADLALAEAWGKLSTPDRQIIALISFDGLDHDSAARVLGISSNAAAQRLSKARSRLKKALSENS